MHQHFVACYYHGDEGSIQTLTIHYVIQQCDWLLSLQGNNSTIFATSIPTDNMCDR